MGAAGARQRLRRKCWTLVGAVGLLAAGGAAVASAAAKRAQPSLSISEVKHVDINYTFRGRANGLRSPTATKIIVCKLADAFYCANGGRLAANASWQESVSLRPRDERVTLMLVDRQADADRLCNSIAPGICRKSALPFPVDGSTTLAAVTYIHTRQTAELKITKLVQEGGGFVFSGYARGVSEPTQKKLIICKLADAFYCADGNHLEENGSWQEELELQAHDEKVSFMLVDEQINAEEACGTIAPGICPRGEAPWPLSSAGTYAMASHLRDSTPTPAPGEPEHSFRRGLWLWKSKLVLNDASQRRLFLAEITKAAMSDVYIYLGASDYTDHLAAIRALNAELTQRGIRAWGLEGYRGYFSDDTGPARLYQSIDEMLAFNKRVAANERFYGFHSDMEPQDGQGAGTPAFHNGLADSKLSKTSGGVWGNTQAEDRQLLMADWISIHEASRARLKAAGLRYGAAMPSWVDNYYGEEVKVNYRGVRQGVMKFIMPLLDSYVVMSYSTDPANAANRLVGELAYAQTLSSGSRPAVHAALETHTGVGASTSYGDHPSKASRAVVFSDMEKIRDILRGYTSLGGIDIHDWVGWRDLPR